MKNKFAIVIPTKAVSVNQAYPTNKQGRRFLSKEGKALKEAIGYWCTGKIPWKLKKTDEFKLNLFFAFKDNRRRDLDDYFKLTIDALTNIAWLDDSQIKIIFAAIEQKREADYIKIMIEKL